MALRAALVVALSGALPLLRRLPWRLLWVVNAGSASDVRAYVPARAEAWIRAHGPALVPMGLLYSRGAGWSLVVASAARNEELQGDGAACRRIAAAAARFRAGKIALNGVLPACLFAHDAWPDDPRFVKEQLGTLFMIRANLLEVAGPRHLRVGVVGVGHTGAQLANCLAEEGWQVVAFDVRASAGARLDSRVEFAGAAFARIAGCDVVVLLSTRGEDGVRALLPHVRPGLVLISDTHPKVPLSLVRELGQRGVDVYECALYRPGTWFFPRLPRWERDTIPGCVGQAYVESFGGAPGGSLPAFARVAEGIVAARLDRPGGWGE